LNRTLKAGREPVGGVREDGEVVVEGHPVGRIEGFRFVPDAPARSEEARSLLTAARRALRDEIARRLKTFEEEGDGAFALGGDGGLTWSGHPVARLSAGEGPLSPAVTAADEALLDQPQQDRVRRRLERWIRERITARLKPLFALRDAAGLSGPARGLAFQLVEGLGFLRRPAVEELIRTLSPVDRKALQRLGVRIAPGHVYLAPLVKPAAVELRALLWAVHAGAALPPPVPPGGRVSVPLDPALPPVYWDAIGYPAAGPRAIRADMLERFEIAVAALDTGPAEAFRALGHIAGCAAAEVDAVLDALGYRRTEAGEGRIAWRRRPPRRRSPAPRPPAAAPNHPFAELRRLTGSR
jgi:ATP-dependent RNA helicase SUPV3L1/SUV3